MNVLFVMVDEEFLSQMPAKRKRKNIKKDERNRIYIAQQQER